VRLSWSGDLGSRGHCRHVTADYPTFTRWPGIARTLPFVGDTIYADQICAGPDRKPGSDVRASSLEEFRPSTATTGPTGVSGLFSQNHRYGIWDDTDVPPERLPGPSEPLMPVGRQAFLDYFPILPPAESRAPVPRSAGAACWSLHLDTRQYRSATRPRRPDKDHAGREQKRWLLAAVPARDGP